MPSTKTGTIDAGAAWLVEGITSMVDHETVAPPLVPQTDDELLQQRSEAMVNEDRWIEEFIARLAAIFREPKR